LTVFTLACATAKAAPTVNGSIVIVLSDPVFTLSQESPFRGFHLCVMLPCRLQDKIATRARLLIDVIYSVRIFAVDASTVFQMKTSGHLGLGTEGNVGINFWELLFD